MKCTSVCSRGPINCDNLWCRGAHDIYAVMGSLLKTIKTCQRHWNIFENIIPAPTTTWSRPLLVLGVGALPWPVDHCLQMILFTSQTWLSGGKQTTNTETKAKTEGILNSNFQIYICFLSPVKATRICASESSGRCWQLLANYRVKKHHLQRSLPV